MEFGFVGVGFGIGMVWGEEGEEGREGVMEIEMNWFMYAHLQLCLVGGLVYVGRGREGRGDVRFVGVCDIS